MLVDFWVADYVGRAYLALRPSKRRPDPDPAQVEWGGIDGRTALL
jgi:hypothetical protein